MPTKISERAVVFLVGAVQFVNILDFMMVMPLGPDFAVELGIPNSHLGVIGGSYTASAAVSGLVSSFFLDRFDRRKALAVAMLGLVLGTLAGGFAVDLPTLMAARILAGAFGGPATSIALSIIADVIPPERRGKAIGAVMAAFSVASVFGVPAGLELAHRGGFRLPFFAVAGVGFLVALCAVFFLPPLRLHLESAKGPEPSYGELLKRPVVLISWAMTATAMMGSFILIPNISAFVQFNIGYPREHLGRLYFVGGILGFATMRLIGSLVDRHGSFRVGTVGTLIWVSTIYVGFYSYLPQIPVMVIFVAFMVTSSMRGVPLNTLTTKVPSPRERARFMSIQSAVQHFSAAIGAFLSAQMLSELPDKRLVGMPAVSLATMGLGLTFPFFLWLVESRVAPAGRPAPAAAPVTEPAE